MKTLELGSQSLTLEQIEGVALGHLKVKLGKTAQKKIKSAHDFLLKKIKSGKTYYGINTGFGLLSNVKIASKDLTKLQLNLIRSHAVGTGPALEVPLVRAMILLRAANLALGHSGVRQETIEQLLALLNSGITPKIPEQGSVGASGDLAPLAHLALTLIGEGEAHYNGKWMPSGEALSLAGLKPLVLEAKEGLALINGTQFMTAIGTLTLLEAERLADQADWIAALTLEALRGTTAAFSKEIHQVRPHPGQVLVAKRIRNLLQSGQNGESEIAKSHKDCGKVQDPYSLRCIPQVHGASRDVFTFVRGILEREVNSVTDNPLLFPEQDLILSGGNFHGQIVAIGMDALAIACAELGSISEQRIEKLVNPAISELPAFLIRDSGINSGYMIIQVAAASIVSENKTLCHPASVDSIPTSADKEDHVSMGAWAARKARKVLENSRRVLSMELMGAAQGIDLLRPLKTTAPLEKLHARVREQIPFAEADRYFHPDLVAAEELLKNWDPK